MNGIKLYLNQSQLEYIRSRLRPEETVSEYISGLVDMDREIYEDMGKYMPVPENSAKTKKG